MTRRGDVSRFTMLWLLVLTVATAGCTDPAPSGEGEPNPPGSDLPSPQPEPPLPALGLNDVSILYPLPDSLETPWYLAPQSVGIRGELLPFSIYDQVPGFPVQPAHGLEYGRMRVLAIRFDGCAHGPDGCEAQIRMVMQPITDEGSTLDSALHLFYALEQHEMAEVTMALRRLRALAPEVEDGAPLNVHPSLVAQGAAGSFGQALVHLVLNYAGEQNLKRMTFFLRAPPINEVWFFGGLDLQDGQGEAMTIVGIGPSNQRVISTDVEGGWDYLVTPEAPVPEDGRVLLTSASAEAATPAEREAAVASFLRVENPTLYTPEDLPCAGCHVSAFVIEQTKLKFSMDEEAGATDRYESVHDLSVIGGAKSTQSSLRAFGYFGSDYMISTRVVNETAEVLDDLDKRFPASASRN